MHQLFRSDVSEAAKHLVWWLWLWLFVMDRHTYERTTVFVVGFWCAAYAVHRSWAVGHSVCRRNTVCSTCTHIENNSNVKTATAIQSFKYVSSMCPLLSHASGDYNDVCIQRTFALHTKQNRMYACDFGMCYTAILHSTAHNYNGNSQIQYKSSFASKRVWSHTHTHTHDET